MQNCILLQSVKIDPKSDLFENHAEPFFSHPNNATDSPKFVGSNHKSELLRNSCRSFKFQKSSEKLRLRTVQEIVASPKETMPALKTLLRS